VYQGEGRSLQPATITTKVTDVQDRVVSTNTATLAADAFAGMRGADYLLDLPLDRLEPGEYLLTVEAAQGTLTARRGLRFTVQ
jgi:hypothetical protein